MNKAEAHLFLKYRFLLCGCLMSFFAMQGCTEDIPAPTGTTFTNGAHCDSPEMYYYASYTDNLIKVLDFSSLESSVLCDKPNCLHNNENCFSQRMYSHHIYVPLIINHNAFFFSDKPMKYFKNDAEKTDIQFGSTLYRRELNTGKEIQLMSIDGSYIASSYGWLLYDGYLYYVGNYLSRQYDENDNIVSCANSGGDMALCRIDLLAKESSELCSLYDIDALSECYPAAPYSTEAYLMGIFGQKLYFNIAFAEEGEQFEGGFTYHFYVTYYDLMEKKYHGTPENYNKINFAKIEYCSEDYLVIRSENQITVSKNGIDEIFTLTDDSFNEQTKLTVFDDMVFCDGKIFDIHTQAVHKSDALSPEESDMPAKNVIAKYENSYILCNEALKFEKIPASQLLGE